MKFTFNEYLGLILAIGLNAALIAMAWNKVIDAQLVAGAIISEATTVVYFFFRKPKPPVGGATP